MAGFLVVVGFIAAILFAFTRVVRSRAQRRIDSLELPPELVAAQRQVTADRAPRSTPAVLRGAMAGKGPVAGSHFMLIYDVAPDFISRRAQYRDEHLALAWKAAEAGELQLAGALEEPTQQAFLLFRGTREAALRFAAADPYVKHGLVKGFRVRQWHTVAGAGAATPVRPKL